MLMLALSVFLAMFTRPAPALVQAPGPETVVIKSGALNLRATIWRPAGKGPFPAILFNHGSYGTRDPMSSSEPETLGPVFARHGYVFLFLFRQGIGLSTGQGTADLDLMDRALDAEGQQARNAVQLQLLEGEEFNEMLAGLAALRARADVDPRRVGVVGHSFGGSLSLLLAEHDSALRAVVVFGAAAGSWGQSPPLRTRLMAAVNRTSVPTFFIHAANDYAVDSGELLDAEMARLKKPHLLKIYAASGETPRDGHNIHYRSVTTWEADVFAFLDPRLKR